MINYSASDKLFAFNHLFSNSKQILPLTFCDHVLVYLLFSLMPLLMQCLISSKLASGFDMIFMMIKKKTGK